MSTAALLGTGLALALLAFVGLAVRDVLHHPFRGLGYLVAAISVHNVIIMLLLRLDTPPLLVRGVQAWKEILLLALAVPAAQAFWRGFLRGRTSVRGLDLIVAAFAALVLVYALFTGWWLAGVTPAQAAISARLLLLMPLLYLFGRLYWPPSSQDLRLTVGLVLGSAAFVGAFGLWELWFVPTRAWVEWGAVAFTNWQGFQYAGPAGLPENFFQSTNAGLGLRRMVSTHLSPLGIAYTGLLVVPLSLFVATRAGRLRWLVWGVFFLITASILLSLTRVAMAMLVIEMVMLTAMARWWGARLGGTWLAAVAIVVTVILMSFQYQAFGPLVTAQLQEVESPTSFLRSQDGSDGDVTSPTTAPTPVPTPGSDTSGELIERVLTQEDASVRAHINALLHGIKFAGAHPLGAGLGVGTQRYGEPTTGPTESALFRITGEVGVIAGLLYLMMYGGIVVAAWRGFRRHRFGPYAGLLLVPLVGGVAIFPVMLTSDIWGDFSVTFLFWWCAGMAVAAATSTSVRTEAPTIEVTVGRGTEQSVPARGPV